MNIKDVKPNFGTIDNTTAVFQDSSVTYNSGTVTYSSSTVTYGGSDRQVDRKPRLKLVKDTKPK
jgi:hypothetical protein